MKSIPQTSPSAGPPQAGLDPLGGSVAVPRGRGAPSSPLEPSGKAKWFAGSVVIGYALISLIPLVWIFMTSFRTPEDAIAYPPKVIAQPSLIGYVNLFTTRSRVGADELGLAGNSGPGGAL